MGKMMLTIVVSMAVLFGLTTFNMMQANTRMTNNAVEEYARIQAKELAESGIEYAIMKISLDTSYQDFVHLYTQEGKIWIDVDPTTSRYPEGPNVGEKGKQIISTGLYNNQMVTVRAVIQIPNIPAVPPFMRFALMSDRDLSLAGSIDVVDDGNTAWNASIHTNEDLLVQGSSIVEGFGSYTLSMDLRPYELSRFFVPNVNPYGRPLASQVPRINIPVFDPTDYIAIADEQYLGAQTTVNGPDLVLGTREAPKIIYVEGDLFISGNLTGYGVFVVQGDIHITGTVSLTSVDPLGNNLGLYSASNIIFHGNAGATGQCYAEGDIIFAGGNDLHGMVTAKGAMSFNGETNIYYRPASDNLTTPFWPGETGRPVLISYYQ